MRPRFRLRSNGMTWTFWICGVVAALAAPAAPAEEADLVRVAERAIDRANPDQVDPKDIKGENWTHDLRFDHPEPIVVTTPGGEKEVYWYIVYTVTNTSGAEKNFVPTFTLYSDTSAIRRAGVYPTVFEAIKKQRKIRFLENAVQMIGKILPGEDNARTGVAIFAPLDRETDRFTIFVEGLSGQYIERPRADAPADAPPDQKVVRLRKTLAIEYKLPGDKWWLNLDQPLFVSKTWTWR